MGSIHIALAPDRSLVKKSDFPSGDQPSAVSVPGLRVDSCFTAAVRAQNEQVALPRIVVHRKVEREMPSVG